MALNVVALMGRLVADPELKNLQSGKTVCSFRLAVDRGRKDANGQTQADFFDLTAWEHTARFIGQYFKKGAMIAVTGRLQSRQYQDKNGNNRTAIEVVVNEASFCGGKNENATRSAAPAQAAYGTMPDVEPPEPQQTALPGSGNQSYHAAQAVPGGDDFAVIDDDEDLPF